ncbi:MAG: winged helix-turn-helix transcriptional regulator [Chloroflexales bacterium]|nr:winged helix-turn-helix transcriptional regulator [Chloroflexales bacterium]
MTFLGFSSNSSAGIILHYLQRHGQATIKDLEGALGISTTAVREHLANLQAEGLIATNTVRRGPGRPYFVYTLTDKAQSLLPKQYDQLINMLLREIVSVEGEEKVEQLLERVSKRLASQYAGQISGEDIRARLDALRATFEAKGIPAEVQQAGDGIKIFACPYYDVAQEHPAVCAMERQMLEDILGEKINLEGSIREGHHNCRFVISDT